MSRWYFTTPIFYVNDKPHLGTAYCTILTDILARYHRLFGDETLFLTGVDEHGQKVQQAATARGLDPQIHCDEMVVHYKDAWKTLEISWDVFFRTTDAFHKKSVQTCLQKLFDQGDIYSSSYKGWYSVSEEIFFTEKDLVDGKSPSGKAVIALEEKNYFFRMSKYQQRLIDLIETDPNFIQPENRKNEVLGFLRNPLEDLCISRPKSRLSWGIELPFDSDYVTYVWFDALLNYATAVGLQQPERQTDFNQWWQSPQTHIAHILGKDIITTHCVYWPTMLMALGVRLPTTIFGHGWILNRDLEKMSKSTGPNLNPLDLVNTVGVDGLRYYLAREIHFGNDAPFSAEMLYLKLNNDLANNLGNLLSRVTQLIEKFFDGHCPKPSESDSQDLALQDFALESADFVQTKVNELAPSHAIERVIQLLTLTNRYLEEKAPWKLVKVNKDQAGQCLRQTLESLRIAAILLSPVMPSKMHELLERLGVSQANFSAAKTWNGIAEGSAIAKGSPLFPRWEV